MGSAAEHRDDGVQPVPVPTGPYDRPAERFERFTLSEPNRVSFGGGRCLRSYRVAEESSELLLKMEEVVRRRRWDPCVVTDDELLDSRLPVFVESFRELSCSSGAGTIVTAALETLRSSRSALCGAASIRASVFEGCPSRR